MMPLPVTERRVHEGGIGSVRERSKRRRAWLGGLVGGLVLTVPAQAADSAPAAESVSRPIPFRPLSLNAPPSAEDSRDDRDDRWVLGMAWTGGRSALGGASYGGLQPLWAFSIGSWRVSRSSADRLFGAPGRDTETGLSTRLRGPQRWSFDLGVRLDRGRSLRDDPRWSAVPDIEHTVRMRLTAQRPWGESGFVSLRADQDLLGRGGGLRWGATLGRHGRFDPATRWTVSVGLDGGDARYLRAHVGVPAAAAAWAGVAPHRPGAGLEAAGLNLGVVHALGPRWALFADAGVAWLQGDAARSPMMDRRQTHCVSLGVAYRSGPGR